MRMRLRITNLVSESACKRPVNPKAHHDVSPQQRQDWERQIVENAQRGLVADG